MIRLSGYSEDDIRIEFTGMRPGEKLYEELLASDEASIATPHPKLRIAKTSNGHSVDVDAILSWIASAGPEPDEAQLRDWLHSQVREYRPVRKL